jgi:hypothetical protein
MALEIWKGSCKKDKEKSQIDLIKKDGCSSIYFFSKKIIVKRIYQQKKKN